MFFFFFSLTIHFFPIFASPFWEKSEWPEKAHSSLCSSEVNLDNSQRYMRDDETRRLSLFNVCVFVYTLHKQWSLPYPLFLYTGSPDPTSENKDKFGRLRSVCHRTTLPFEPRKANKNSTKWKTKRKTKPKAEEISSRKQQKRLCRLSVQWL